MSEQEPETTHESPQAGGSPGEDRVTVQRVLIVEDDREQWEILRRTAESIVAAVQIDFVDTAEDGIDRLSEETVYDLVMSDFLLGGTKTGHWLRSHCERLQPNARFAMMSSMPIGSLGEEDVPFLSKPFTVAECRAFLTDVLR